MVRMAISDLVKEFVESAKRYLGNETDSSPELRDGNGERVVFADDLLRAICKKPQEYHKYFNSIWVYGYMGLSKGGVNGIVRVRKTDKNLMARIDTFLESAKGNELLRQYELNAEELEPVKVVAHVMKGDRLIGVRRCGLTLLIDKVGYKK